MGPSMAYGQLPHTPEPDSEQFDKIMIATISSPNPTYNSTYSKPYEHMYESIDHVMVKKQEEFESYDTPKPQLPAPRPSINDNSACYTNISENS